MKSFLDQVKKAKEMKIDRYCTSIWLFVWDEMDLEIWQNADVFSIA